MKANCTSRKQLQTELSKERLHESADQYAEAYEKDDETQEWINVVLSEWPT